MKRQRPGEPMASSSAPAEESSANTAPDVSGNGEAGNDVPPSGNIPSAGPDPHYYHHDSSFQIKAPIFDNTVKGFPTFKSKCNLFYAQMCLKKQSQYAGLQLLSNLSGNAWKLCEDLATDATILSDPKNGEKVYHEIMGRLEHRFGESDITKLPEVYENYFIKGQRLAK